MINKDIYINTLLNYSELRHNLDTIYLETLGHFGFRSYGAIMALAGE